MGVKNGTSVRQMSAVTLTILLCLARPDARNRFQEQLGLKPGHRRVPIDMIVVDHIERPSAD
jgi:uncharacterized protein (TIGR03435 family)